jgi:hypothetical protein
MTGPRILAGMAERRLIPHVDGLTPLEAADLVHVEAQFLAKRLGLRALPRHPCCPVPPAAGEPERGSAGEVAAAAPAIDDPEPYVPGSFDDVVRVYDLGWLSDPEYEALAAAAAS